MARFIVVHKLPDVATQDEVIAAGRAIIAASSNGSRWLRSWVVPEDDRLLCEWEAPDEAAIQAALKGAKLFPVEAIHPVTTVDPVWFKEQEGQDAHRA
jgi:hypothetical protein